MLELKPKTALDKKIETYQAILEKDRELGEAILALAESCERRGLRLEAMALYQKALKEYPGFDDILLSLVGIYFYQGMKPEAFVVLEELMEKGTSDVSVRLFLEELKAMGEEVPEKFESITQKPIPMSAVQRLTRRQKVYRLVCMRELHELSRWASEEPDVPVHEYNRKEAQKRLIRVERELEILKQFEAIAEEDTVTAIGGVSLEELNTMPERDVEKTSSHMVPELEVSSVLESGEGEFPSVALSLETSDHLVDPLGVASSEEEVVVTPQIEELEPVVEELVEVIPEIVEIPEMVEIVEEVSVDPVGDFSLSKEAEAILERLSKARSILGVAFYHRGEILKASGERGEDIEMLGDSLASAIELLEDLGSNLDYWVMEFKVGLMACYGLNPGQVLVVWGGKGANLGSLKYTIEKIKKPLLASLEL